MLLWLMIACAPEPAPEDRFADIHLDPMVWWTRSDPGDRVPLGGAEVVADQLLVAGPPSALGAAVDALDATVIGHLPPIGVAQLAVDAPDAAALRAAMAVALAVPGVQAAAPNAVLRHADCPNSVDNEALEGPARCAAEDIGFFPLDRMAEALRLASPPRRVRVAVLDTGLSTASGQFDDTPVFNLDAPGQPLFDLDGHGTRVAGLIAADDGDGGTAGFASAVLGDALELVVMSFDETTMGSLVGMIRAGGDARALVANLSMGTVYEVGDEDVALAENTLYRRAAAAYPDTLFLTSSDNQWRETRADNYSPAELGLPNFISVGGTSACDPTVAWADSGWGASVAIAAPAHNVAVLNVSAASGAEEAAGPPRSGSGNSYSSPIVAAAAAILRGFDPSLSPAETVARLVADAGPTDPAVSGRALDIGRPVLTALVDRGRALELLDRTDPPGQADPPALVAHRVCGTVDIEVRGLGRWRFDTAGADDLFGAGQVFADPLNFGLGDAVDVALPMAVVAPFMLDQPWAVSPEGPALVSLATSTHFGYGTAGELRLTWCAVTQRRPGGADTPAVLEVELLGQGAMDAAPIVDPLAIASYPFTLAGTLPMAVFTEDDVTMATLEASCEGGYGAP